MKLTPEQKKMIAQWVAAGDSLSSVQSRMAQEWQVSLTYMETRFLVDDLGLEFKEPPKKAPATDLSAAAAARPEAGAAGPAPAGELAEEEEETPAEDAPPAASGVSVEIDTLTRPGTVVSGTAVFSDGQKAKWALDQYGRLLFEPAQKGYRPPAADLQAFQMEIERQLQAKGY